MENQRVTVLGDGGWGTCLAVLLAGKGLAVTLWGAFPEYVREMDRARNNRKFLPDVAFPDALRLTADPAEAIRQAEVVVVAVPSPYVRQTLSRVPAPTQALVVSVVKGLEPRTLLRMSEVIAQAWGVRGVVVLSGPSIAYEVARGVPTTVVAAAADPARAERIQRLFSTERFRVYRSADVIGVELGGALKNIIAIAAGIADGLGFGANTKSALLARGLAEMARLGVAMGAQRETFSGVSGVGDLATTCFSEHSRNRKLGEQVAKGKTLQDIQGSTEQVAEGAVAVQSAVTLAARHHVEMPIAQEVARVLYEGKPPQQAVRDLMLRDPKEED
ncbi:MAG: NAD(P)-dependent glycerol-3-phosphate dehydrogenase [Candidatus Omnitrophica bacterium]|nr:NAD(P)-dependent glycerol-3-phosphate dehydrogenase [Candidatus Omnitrophota bacterium]